MIDQKDFEPIKIAYPKRLGGQNWTGAMRQVEARIREGYTIEQMLEGAKRYAKYIRLDDKERTCYVKQAVTFFGRDLHFLEDFGIDESVTCGEKW